MADAKPTAPGEAAGRPVWRRLVWPAVVGLVLAAWAIDHFVPGLLTGRPFYTSDRAHITGVLRDQATSWNEGDLDGFMSAYWHSDQLTFYSGGTVTSGWQATFDRYHKKYRAEGGEMGTLAFDDITIDVHGPDAAVVRGRWALTFAKSPEAPHGLFTLVLRRFPEGWKIVHDHTSAAEPPRKPE